MRHGHGQPSPVRLQREGLREHRSVAPVVEPGVHARVENGWRPDEVHVGWTVYEADLDGIGAYDARIHVVVGTRPERGIQAIDDELQ